VFTGGSINCTHTEERNWTVIYKLIPKSRYCRLAVGSEELKFPMEAKPNNEIKRDGSINVYYTLL
jgi:hypothetical protein